MAIMLMLANWVNTTGEYILSNIVKQNAEQLLAAGASGLTEGQIIGDFYSKYFTYVNILSLLMQLFLVSRIVKWFGIGWAVMVLPFIALGAYNVIIFIPTLTAVMSAKVAENSDRLLAEQHRAQHALPAVYL